jgi:hypothetical protein
LLKETPKNAIKRGKKGSSGILGLLKVLLTRGITSPQNSDGELIKNGCLHLLASILKAANQPFTSLIQE